ncbi:hypothetical protein [Glutamicibacter sp. AOP5-A2-18]|uniref:hypothetical protein n=1 Tax=Glutamicibacter sp. AOP5-A2-18 TaxID=3457656 RepID=UPI0040342AD6
MSNDEIDKQFLFLIEHNATRLREAKDKLDERRKLRDESIVRAIESGVTMYAIAKHAGISQSAVAQIRDNNKEKK